MQEETKTGEVTAQGGARPILRSAFVVGFFTLISRVTGLLRESTHARFLGTGMPADAFRVAFLLPNLMRRLVGEGAVSSAFVPVYAQRCHGRGDEEGRIFAEKFMTLWFVVVGVITVGGVLLSGAIISLCFGWGLWDAQKLDLTAAISRVVFWYLLLVAGVAAAQGILNARGVFGLPSFAPALFNVVFVAAAYLLVPYLGNARAAFAISFAVLIGGAAQLLVLIPPLWKIGIRFRLRNPFDHPGVREVMRLLVPGTVGAGVYQINVAVSTAFTTRLQEGAAASLGYSVRLMEFVLGVFVFSLSTVSLTVLARQAAGGDRPAFQKTLSEVLRLIVFITVPSTVGLYLLRRPVLAFLFESGQFGKESVELTASAFRFHILGTAFVGVNRALVTSFYSRKEVNTPVVLGIVDMVLNLALAYWLSSGALAHAGIALAATLAAVVQTGALLCVLLVRMRGLRFPGLYATCVKTLIASGIMGVLCYFGLGALWTPAVSSKTAQGIVVAALVLGGGLTFAAAAWILKLEELRMVLAGVLSRGRRRREDTR